MKFGLLFQYLKLLQREAFACPHSRVVLERWAPNDRAEEACGRARRNGGGFLQSLESPRLLPPRLVEPRLHPTLPVFLEVCVRYHPIALGSHVDRLQGATQTINSHKTRTQQRWQLKNSTATSGFPDSRLPGYCRSAGETQGRSDRGRYPQRT